MNKVIIKIDESDLEVLKNVVYEDATVHWTIEVDGKGVTIEIIKENDDE